jgi:two-component system, LytTR family, sensor kinase
MTILNSTLILVSNRWLWHCCFWVFYFFIRIRPYYNTILFYDDLFLKYMLSAELLFFATTYATLFLFNQLVPRRKTVAFLMLGLSVWIVYVLGDVHLKKFYLGLMPNFANYNKWNMFLDSIAYYIFFFLFIVLLKYFKNNFIEQYNQSQLVKQQIQFELANLKSQIAPHFLFNTMNNFYGLAVEKSSKLPDLMIRLSDLFAL